MRQNNNVNVMFGNGAISALCSKRVKIAAPTHSNLNEMISQVISSFTASLRFDGALHLNLGEFSENLVPYPRIN